jgi:hypothetical protein
VTKALLEAGAVVAQATTLGVQPLHMAAQEGQVSQRRNTPHLPNNEFPSAPSTIISRYLFPRGRAPVSDDDKKIKTKKIK